VKTKLHLTARQLKYNNVAATIYIVVAVIAIVSVMVLGGNPNN